VRHLYLLLAAAIVLFTVGCSAPVPEPVKVELTRQTIDYLADVKPILDKRCVVCHSCYNSPCQAKFSAYEGVDRGGSKLLVYDATRLRAINPTRLFIDAQSTQQWRTKGFFSLTESLDTNISYNDSIMIHMLKDKMEHPEVIGEYAPEYDKLICPRNSLEMGTYLEDKPNHGMPYGFPRLKEKEYNTLAQWLQQGANGPTAAQQQMITSPSAEAAKEIAKWEAFLNTPDPKHAMTARYLYEHYFLAHLNFKAAPTEFYKLVRSRTAAPQAVDLVPSLRPFDNPGTATFYYRFRRIHSTIVHKTHMVVEFDDAELARINELFIQPEWMEKPHLVGYKTKMSANPFVTFFQIPVRSRYQFLLDHNNYIVMTFIRGPVCRGQMALNVIHDHFWVMFQDPDYELSIQQPGFLLLQADNLSMPIESVNKSVLDTFSDAYLDRYEAYYKAKEALYDRTYPNGIGLEGIWKGNTPQDSPLLTVYRHFDSASVQRGVVGKLPRTMWVIDYPQFERIYYALVAGYDVYGNLSHQTNIRRYMDFLRMEGEINFLAYMPPEKRLNMFKSWYIGDSDIQDKKSDIVRRGTKIVYKTDHPKDEFIEQVVKGHILKSTGIGFDSINYYSPGDLPPKMPTAFKTVEDIRNGARSLTAPGTAFIRQIVDFGANLIHVRVILPDGKDRVFTFVINRWHNNVNSLFSEKDRLDSSKDTIDIVPGSVGSYPNVFAVVDYRDLPDFFDMIANFQRNEHYLKKFKKYFISRSDERFWETYDWFQSNLNSADPLQAGLYDLNRYYRKEW
jgi:hypothetical protein